MATPKVYVTCPVCNKNYQGKLVDETSDYEVYGIREHKRRVKAYTIGERGHLEYCPGSKRKIRIKKMR